MEACDKIAVNLLSFFGKVQTESALIVWVGPALDQALNFHFLYLCRGRSWSYG